MRHEFSRKVRRQAWERANGRCEGYIWTDGGYTRCTAPIDLGRFIYDHIDPDFISGRNDLHNCAVICFECNRAKTARDQGAIAKVKRIRDRQIKALTSKRPLPFGRNSRLKKKISGQVVER
jgi:5-methylcytosine-specific restriction endonuclease McrA